MSYQVLARKWRPKTFREMVGQEHVLQAMINALDHDRLHHAYLFTGTRGVGKTTIARILSKCLNCDTGVSSEPCGVCTSCKEIDEGRFVDLIEVDAASRTRVEDTRELLDNVQYAPTRGRYKVYLIDEVHMLSTHSFNALLKTLEEPPPHVKFLLATTDPQKLPVTILSRCLQFSLKNMPPQRVVEHLSKVLETEMIPFEEEALWELGRAADGSMRDAMSLTDQAIAFSGGKLEAEKVRVMLGTIDRGLVHRLVATLAEANIEEVMQVVAELADHAPDYVGVLAEFISFLHRIAVAQAIPSAVDDSFGDANTVQKLAAAMTAEDVQLYYQIALQGRKDLPLNPDQRAGFEMVLLRMLLFKPQGVMPSPPNGGGNRINRPAMDANRNPQASGGAMAQGPANGPTAGSSNAVAQSGGSPNAAPPVSASPRANAGMSPIAQAKAAINDPSKRVILPNSPTAVAAQTEANNAMPQTAPSQNAAATQTDRQAQQSGQASPMQPSSPPPAPPSMPEDEPPPEYDFIPPMEGEAPTADYSSGGYGDNVVALNKSTNPARSANADVQAPVTEPSSAPSAPVTSSQVVAAENIVQIKPDEPYGDPWADLVNDLQVKGGTLNLARNCALESQQGGDYHLALAPSHEALLNQQSLKKLEVAIAEHEGIDRVSLKVTLKKPPHATPLDLAQERKRLRIAAAEQSLLADPFIQQMQQSFTATLVKDSVKPID